MSTRRNFLKTLSGMALLTVVPRHVLGGPKHVAPSDQLTKGIIGVGGIGKSSYHFTSTKECRLVAVCDVDSKHLQSALDLGKKRFNETLQSYRDFRRLIADPNVDIVHIATPPHWHGIMAVEAAKAGKDIWCEKPMTRTIGEGNQQRLRPLVHTLQVLFVSIGLCSGLLIFLLRVPILALLGGTLTETAYKYSLQFMMVLAITTVGTSYQMACDNGIIRGGGDTKFSAKMNIISMWLIVVPFSAMAAFWWKFPPVVVFFLLKWDQLYKIIPVAIRLHSWKWVKKVTRPDTAEG